MIKFKEITTSQNCELCGCSDFKEVYKKTHHFNFCNPFDQKIIVCTECGLSTIELNDSYSDENISNYYRSVLRTPLDIAKVHSDDPRVINAKKRIDFIKRNTTGKKLLEIGFGDGITLLEASKYGYDSTGIDLTEGYDNQYQFLKTSGISIVNSDFYSFNIKDKFDIVAAFLLFEHIKHPSLFLKKVSDCLTDEGFLIIEVPNLSNYKDFLSDTMLTHEHIFHFTYTTLNALLLKNGFKLIASQPKGTSYGFSMTNCYQKNENNAFKSIVEPDKNSLNHFMDYFKVLDSYKKTLLDELELIIQGSEKIFVFGAGLFFEFLLKLSGERLRNKIIAIIDETPEKIGTSFKGIKIISIDDVDRTMEISVLIASEAFSKEISKKLINHNPNIIPIQIYPKVLKKIKNDATR